MFDFRVDPLYAFFVQWTPELYGSDEDIKPEERGFVVIEDDEDDEDFSLIEDHYDKPEEAGARRLHRQMTKDWEVSNGAMRLCRQMTKDWEVSLIEDHYAKPEEAGARRLHRQMTKDWEVSHRVKGATLTNDQRLGGKVNWTKCQRWIRTVFFYVVDLTTD